MSAGILAVGSSAVLGGVMRRILIFWKLAKQSSSGFCKSFINQRLKLPPFLRVMFFNSDPALRRYCLRLIASNLLMKAKVFRLQCTHKILNFRLTLFELRFQFWVLFNDWLLHATGIEPPNDPKLSHGANNRKRGFASKRKIKEQPPLAPARC
jgi:hypothetical protein